MTLYSLLFLNEFALLKMRVDEFSTKRQKTSKEYSILTKLHYKYRIIFVFRVFCLIFIYISLIAAVTSSIPFVGVVTNVVASFGGLIGIPVFSAIWLFLGKLKGMVLIDAQFVASTIISKKKFFNVF